MYHKYFITIDPFHRSGSTCEICGDPIGFAESLRQTESQYLVCNSFDCKRIISPKSSMSPASFKLHVEIQKKINLVRRENEAARKKHIKEIEIKELQQNQEIFHAVLIADPALLECNTYLLSIPSGLSSSVCLSGQRVKKYTDFLKRIISEAAAEHSAASEILYDQHHDAHEKLAKLEEEFSNNPALRPISDKLCGICKGGCCASGEEHAYHSVATIKHYMDAHPDISEQGLLELFLFYIGSETIDDACINQTKTGCTLPRELRSDICNGYYCDSLKSYHRKLAGKAEIGAILVIQRSYTNWSRFNADIDNKIINVVVLVGEEQFQHM